MTNATKHKKNAVASFFDELRLQYFPYWPSLVIVTVVFLIVAAVYLRFTTPVYQATATILIKDEKKGADESKMAESLNFLSSKKIVENELEVIHSRDIMAQVVDSLHLYAPVYQEGKLKAVSAYATSPVSIQLKDRGKVKEFNKIYFRYDSVSKTVNIDNKAYPLDQFVSTPYGEIQFSTNKHFINTPGKPLYFSLIEPKKITGSFLNKLDVTSAGKLSSIVNLKIRDEVPSRAEDILNVVLDKYNNGAIEYKNKLAQNTIAFVDQRLRIVSAELNAVEKQIQNYRASKGVVNLSEQSRLYLQNVGNNDQKLGEINTQLAVLNQVEKYVTSKDNTPGIVPSVIGINDPMLTKLLDNLYQSEMDYEKLRKTTAENNAIASSVRDKIKALRSGILENIQNQRQSLEASKGNVSNTNRAYNSTLLAIPQKERELVEVSREQSVKNSIYSFLLQKREETALAYAANLADSKIIETPQASVFPVSPKKSIIYLIACVSSILVILAYIFFRRLVSNKIVSISQIEEYTDVPIVSQLKGRDDTMIQEELRQLRIATGLASRDNSKRKILITSGIPGEGKSSLACHLAVSLSLSGKKVVLVDADFNNPYISKNFQLSATKGLGNYLEENASLSGLISELRAPNLFVMPAGKTRQNTTELLLTGKLPALFTYLEKEFDYIIFDSSPLNSVVDAYVLSEYFDLTLYVIRQGFTSKIAVKNLDHNITTKPIQNLAIVFNCLKSKEGIKKGESYEFEGYPKKNLSTYISDPTYN